MLMNITSGRIKPKKESTFGKKPFKGKNKNRTGNKKESLFSHERIKKKVSGKNVRKDFSLNLDKPVRFSKAVMKKRNIWINENIGVCQICEVSTQLDVPHHALSGSGLKDDRPLICICVTCHPIVHFGKQSDLKKTREEILAIGWENHKIIPS